MVDLWSILGETDVLLLTEYSTDSKEEAPFNRFDDWIDGFEWRSGSRMKEDESRSSVPIERGWNRIKK